MRVIFYNNKSDKKVAQKDLTLISTIECDIYNTLNVLTPDLVINNRQHNLLNCNYCYIAELNRYYYCDVTIYKHQTVIQCTVDPLKSHITEIQQLYCTAVRNENGEFSALADNNIMYTVEEEIKQYKLQENTLSFDETSIIFTCQ